MKLWTRRKSCNNRAVDVFIDIDDTLVYADKGGFTIRRVSYRLAHGAAEFLLALSEIPNVRINFYSAGADFRNVDLIKQVMDGIKNRRIKFHLFSKDRLLGLDKKKLSGVKKGVNLERAILIDDQVTSAESGEERNLLKVYENNSELAYKDYKDHTHTEKVFKLRLQNNLVRALGMILWSMEVANRDGCTLVKALSALQWDGENYRHEETNTEEIYELGLVAMRHANPDFELFENTTQEQQLVHPWSSHDSDDRLFSNPLQGDPRALRNLRGSLCQSQVVSNSPPTSPVSKGILSCFYV